MDEVYLTFRAELIAPAHTQAYRIHKRRHPNRYVPIIFPHYIFDSFVLIRTKYVCFHIPRMYHIAWLNVDRVVGQIGYGLVHTLTHSDIAFIHSLFECEQMSSLIAIVVDGFEYLYESACFLVGGGASTDRC